MTRAINEGVRIDIGELAPLFYAAFEDFLGQEADNITNGTSEQNLCGRLAMLLDRQRQEVGLVGYFVDTEYNRNGGKVKTIIGEVAQTITIRCDIIVHSRGTIFAQDNLLVVEMKRSNHTASEKNKDRVRLRAMTKQTYDDVWSADRKTFPEHVCGYVVGYYLELNRRARRFLVEEYAGGQQTGSAEVTF
ncbi:hypothetical protein [Rhizobium ruizarguesonis]|uniref:hypothetical protein n=1 Tax=Rhizobium ruizarguesonis TaxID=2081791 RepID=UPI00102F783A|nr:hypothetical protein [Rhizobium ruizarguesonis]TBA92716.1 hypothetical protein ELH54_24190 [Rhizobium ruizarguesonis]